MTPTLQALAEAAGIVPRYVDQTGRERVTSEETARGLLAGMNLPAETEAAAAETLEALRRDAAERALAPTVVVEAEREARLPLPPGRHRWTLVTEDGERSEGAAEAMLTLPPLPLGYHRLEIGGASTTLLAAPARLPLPERAWGVTLGLYALRPPGDPGHGDYGDLASAATALGAQGAAFVGANPIHAGFPNDASAPSPYSPSHRRRLNVAYIPVQAALPPGGEFVDYGPTWEARRAALEAEFRLFQDREADPGFEHWLAEGGEELHRFAVHQALSDEHDSYWSAWPAALTRPASPEVAAFAEAHASAVRFHAWLQWRAEAALSQVAAAARAAGMRHGLYLDLAVGTHPHGAETWADPTQFAQGVSLGAPPDAFSKEGQRWGLAPFNPRQLLGTGMRALAETLCAQLRFAKLLRIDHILGFDRAFWVPEGAPGAYVQMPREQMLAVVRIEAARAGATVVGEDLGNIPEGLPEVLSGAGLLGCRVVMFERTPDGWRPALEWDEAALGSFGTHDLPVWRGWRSGRDIAWRRDVGDIDAEQFESAMAERERDVADFDALLRGEGAAGDDPESPDGMHRFLGRTRSALVALQIEDMLDLVEQPNLPGTIDQHPNWRRKMPIGPAAMAEDERIARAAEIMRETGR